MTDYYAAAGAVAETLEPAVETTQEVVKDSKVSPPANFEEKVTSKTSISSLGELKEKAPKVYHAMLVGIASGICMEMQKGQDRIKKMRRELS